MTLERLEKRVDDLERQLSELRNLLYGPRDPKSVEETFGFMDDDAEFDEIVRLGQEYRVRANGGSA